MWGVAGSATEVLGDLGMCQWWGKTQESCGTYLHAAWHGVLRVAQGVLVHVEVTGGGARWAWACEAKACGLGARCGPVIGGGACDVMVLHGLVTWRPSPR